MSSRDVANRIPITGGLMLATLMNTLDSTIANVALPHIQGSVSAGIDQITWVLTSYILATAIMTPLSGWLSMKIGRKKMLLFSIGGFTIASMLCGIATSLPEIVIFRVLQGIAGASLMPLSQTMMLDLYEPQLVPRVMSIWSAAVIIGPIVGPTLGGWLTEALSWRWVFYINLPIGILAFMSIFSFMDADPGGRQRPFDFLGFGALVLFIGMLQIVLDRGPGQDWLESQEIWIELTLAAIGLWVFVMQTATAEHPFFHRDLIKDANFVGTTVFGFFVGVLLFSTQALLPSFMQNLLGYSSMQAGIASMPRGLGSLVAFLAVPFFVQWFGPKPNLFLGVSLCIGALLLMGQFDLSMTPDPIMLTGFIQGLGIGLIFAPLNTLAYATLNPIHRTEGTIVSTMVRSLGSSAGISAVQAMLLIQSAGGHANLAGGIDPSAPLINWSLPSLMNPTTPEGLALLNGEITRQGTMIAYNTIFAWMAAGMILLLPIIVMLKRPPPLPAMGAAQPVREVHAD
jgi:DHA2 family multidrug resistance protein